MTRGGQHCSSPGAAGAGGATVSLPRVVFFHRRRRRGANFSIERIFEDVRARLGGAIEPVVSVASFESSGVLRRAWACLEAWFRQGDINHVTGDINFVGLLLDPRRTVQTIHDLGHLARTTGLRHALLKLLWVTIPVERCALVTVVSETTRQELLRLVPSCPADKVVVIPNALLPGFEPDPRPFNETSPRILQIGTAPNKNLTRVAEALRGIDCHLDIVGRLSGPQRQSLVDANIRYSSRSDLSAEDVREAYRKSDLVVFASTYEGFGMPILEAQGIGRPIITSKLPPMPDVAGPGAILVDPFDVGAIRDAVLQIRSEPALRAQLVRSGFENVQRFAPERIAEQYLHAYHDVLDQRTRGSGMRDSRPR